MTTLFLKNNNNTQPTQASQYNRASVHLTTVRKTFLSGSRGSERKMATHNTLHILRSTPTVLQCMGSVLEQCVQKKEGSRHAKSLSTLITWPLKRIILLQNTVVVVVVVNISFDKLLNHPHQLKKSRIQQTAEPPRIGAEPTNRPPSRFGSLTQRRNRLEAANIMNLISQTPLQLSNHLSSALVEATLFRIVCRMI